MHASVIRPYSHSLSDDEAMYRPPAERDADAARDPLTTFPQWLVAEGHATEADTRAIQDGGGGRSAGGDGRRAGAAAAGRRHQDALRSTRPTSIRRGEQFDTEDDPQFAGEPTTMVDLLNACMRTRCAAIRKILMFGEDVADVSREAYVGEVKGKGGVFKVTWGLQKEFGGVARLQLAAGRSEHRRPRDRARDARIQAGRRDPVLRLHLAGVHAAARRARDDAVALQQRTSPSPVVVRVTYGGYIRGAIYHSQTGASLFTHCPGLRVVCPSTALDANGLLRTAIRCDDPVIFLEHKHLYRQTYNKAANPGPNFMIPFGKARGRAARATTSRS